MFAGLGGDLYTKPSMDRSRGQPCTWLLLIVFSINALLPAGAGRWDLCVGCDNVGLTLVRADATPLGSSDSCCENTNSSDEDQRPDRLTSHESLSACDCVRIPVENHGLPVIPSSLDGPAPTFALLCEATDIVVLHLPTDSITARGPPDAGWLPVTHTLLGQHTSLII